MGSEVPYLAGKSRAVEKQHILQTSKAARNYPMVVVCSGRIL